MATATSSRRASPARRSRSKNHNRRGRSRRGTTRNSGYRGRYASARERRSHLVLYPRTQRTDPSNQSYCLRAFADVRRTRCARKRRCACHRHGRPNGDRFGSCRVTHRSSHRRRHRRQENVISREVRTRRGRADALARPCEGASRPLKRSHDSLSHVVVVNCVVEPSTRCMRSLRRHHTRKVRNEI